MIDLITQPNLTGYNFLDSCAVWELKDLAFVTDAGSPAILTAVFFNTTYPNGLTFTALGIEIEMTDTLVAGEFGVGTISNLGTTEDIANALAAFIENNFYGLFDVVVDDLVGFTGHGVTATALNNGILANSETVSNPPVNLSLSQGSEATYSNSRIVCQLLRGNTVVSEKTQPVRIVGGEVAPSRFDFKKEIAEQLTSHVPNFTDEIVEAVNMQSEFRIRYARQIPVGTGYDYNTNFEYSDYCLFINAVRENDDGREGHLYPPAPHDFLNDYQETCVKGKYAWMYIPVNANRVLSESVGITYGLEIKTDSLTTTGILSQEDGMYVVPVGEANIGQATPSNITGNYEVQALMYLNINGTTYPLPLTHKIKFNTVNDCSDAEVYWREPHGVYSTMCFSYEDERNVTTEGETACIARLCGRGYDKLKNGHRFIFNKTTKQQTKLVIEKSNTRGNERTLLNFLASDEYYYRAKDMQGNNVMRKIVPEYGTTGLYKKRDLLELVFTFSNSEEENTISKWKT